MAIIEVEIDNDLISQVKSMAEKMEIGGRSNIRSGIDRKQNLSQDQFVSQLCECSLHLFWSGHNLNWVINRYYRNQFPNIGDNGSDMPPSNIDVKGSLWRYKNKPLLDHNLIVRPKEFYPGKIYILAFADQDIHKVYLIGWATSEMLKFIKDGEFGGDYYLLPAKDLYPLPPVKWNWFA